MSSFLFWFIQALALSSNAEIVGVPLRPWKQKFPILPTEDMTTTLGDRFGESVAISWSGDVIAVAAPGTNNSVGVVQCFEWNSGAWTKLGADIAGLRDPSGSGGFAADIGTVKLSSDAAFLAVSSPGSSGPNGDESGLIRVFYQELDSWTEVGASTSHRIYGKMENENIGRTMALSGNGQVVAFSVGTNTSFYFPSQNVPYGFVRVYRLHKQNQTTTTDNDEVDPSQWIQEGTDLADSYYGDASHDAYGYSIALNFDGTILAVGAPTAFGPTGGHEGAVFVYQYDNDSSNGWTQMGQTLNGGIDFDEWGDSVSLSADGSTLAVGRNITVFQYDTSSEQWIPKGEKIGGSYSSTMSMSPDGRILAQLDVVVGDGTNFSPSSSSSSSINMYRWKGDDWVRLGRPILAPADFQSSVMVTTDDLSRFATVIIGTPSLRNDTGHVAVYEWVYGLAARRLRSRM